MAHAEVHRSLLPALSFFLGRPSPDRAARLLIDRHGEINGDTFELLGPATEALSERHPLAATLALRAMLDFTLSKARSKCYALAARHLKARADPARRIEDFGALATHAVYAVRLTQEHGRKSGFWSLTEA